MSHSCLSRLHTSFIFSFLQRLLSIRYRWRIFSWSFTARPCGYYGETYEIDGSMQAPCTFWNQVYGLSKYSALQAHRGHLGIVSQDLRMNLDHLPASWFRARMLPETCRNHWYPLVKHRISHKEHIFILLFMYLPIPILLEPKHPTDTEWQAKVPRTGRATELLPRILLTKCTEPGWVVAGTKSTNGQECRALSPWGPDTLRKSHSKWGALEVFFWNQGWKPGGWYKLHGSDPRIVDDLEVWFG